MIKLLDDPKLIEKLCIAEPYIGCIFLAAATAFYDTPDLMTVWAEFDEHNKAVSAVNICSGDLMVLSGGNIPGAEMLFFLTKLAEDSKITDISCGEAAFPVLKKIFGGKTEALPLMKCSRHVKYERDDIPNAKSGDAAGLYKLMLSEYPENEKPDFDMWMLKHTRDINRGQSTVLTIEQDGVPVSGACIRGRCKSGGAIVSVITEPEYRGRGYASALTAQCAEMLRSEGLAAWLCPCDTRAERLYSRLGFKRCGSFYTIYLDKEENKNE